MSDCSMIHNDIDINNVGRMQSVTEESGPDRPIPLSIIVPMLNEEEHLPTLLESLRPISPIEHEVILVDGGSSDRTVEIGREYLRERPGRLIEAGGGRGEQLLSGGEAARGEFLLFLHADSIITPEAGALVASLISGIEPTFRIGTFRLQFDRPGLLYRLYSFVARFDSIWTTFGDQGILVSRQFYRSIGGFPPYPLFEDVEFFRRARFYRPIRKFREGIITSARRFEAHGLLRNQWRNFLLIWRYLLGDGPERLAESYEGSRRGR